VMKTLAPLKGRVCNTVGTAQPLSRFFAKPVLPQWEARLGMADIFPPGKKPASFQKPANDNEPSSDGMRAVVTIAKDSPIAQVEIEVIAYLLDDWAGIATNDNEDLSK
jgi:hypothetical protein